MRFDDYITSTPNPAVKFAPLRCTGTALKRSPLPSRECLVSGNELTIPHGGNGHDTASPGLKYNRSAYATTAEICRLAEVSQQQTLRVTSNSGQRERLVLSVEIDASENAIQVYRNGEGVESLISELTQLRGGEKEKK